LKTPENPEFRQEMLYFDFFIINIFFFVKLLGDFIKMIRVLVVALDGFFDN
jgi:hypothetical protein